MLLKENPAAAAAMIQAAKRTQAAAHPRAEGIHVSDLVYCLRRAWYKRNGYSEPESQEQDTIFLMGQGHHGLLQCEGEYEKAITLRLGGETVFGTVDLLLADGTPVEIKTTRYSANKDVAAGLSHYVEQLAAYCLGLGRDFGRLAIWHLMGDYNRRNGQPPVLRVWDVQFEPGELIAWEDELTQRVDELVERYQLYHDFYPDDHYKWECDYCPFYQEKGGPCPGGEGRTMGFFAQRNLPAWAGGK